MVDFRALAARGAKALGHNTNLLSTWLSELHATDLEAFKPRADGVFLNLCEASISLCQIEEYTALETDVPAIVAESAKEAPPEIQAETIAEQLTRLRAESRLTVEQLTAAVDIDQRNVERHLSGQSKPRIGNIGAYERVFSNVLKRKVVIS